MNKDKDITLHYIDKLHLVLLETGKAMNRSIISVVGISLIITALASGLAYADNRIEIIGIRINISSWILPFVGAWILLFVYIRSLALYNQKDRLCMLIIKLYHEIHFSDDEITDPYETPLKYPDIVETFVRQRNIRLGRGLILVNPFVFFLTMILPLCAAGYVAYKLFATQGYAWWLISSFVIILFMMIFYQTRTLEGPYYSLEKESVQKDISTSWKGKFDP